MFSPIDNKGSFNLLNTTTSTKKGTALPKPTIQPLSENPGNTPPLTKTEEKSIPIALETLHISQKKQEPDTFSGALWKCIRIEPFNGVEEGFTHVFVLQDRFKEITNPVRREEEMGMENSRNFPVVEKYPEDTNICIDNNPFLQKLGYSHKGEETSLPNGKVIISCWEKLEWPHKGKKPKINIIDVEGIVPYAVYIRGTNHYNFLLASSEFPHDSTVHIINKLMLIYNHFEEFHPLNETLSEERNKLLEKIENEKNKPNLNQQELICLELIEGFLAYDADSLGSIGEIEWLNEKVANGNIAERIIKDVNSDLKKNRYGKEIDTGHIIRGAKEKFGEAAVNVVLEDLTFFKNYIIRLYNSGNSTT